MSHTAGEFLQAGGGKNVSDQVKGYLRRTLVMLPAVPLMALGISLCVFGNLGSDPFTAFQQGIGNLSGLQVGDVSMICNVSIVVAFIFIDRKMVNVGSVIFAFCTGPCINFFNGVIRSIAGAEFATGWVAYLYPVIGNLLITLALAYYLPIDLGIQALDMLSLTVGERMLKKTYGVGLYIVYAVMFALALLMKAPWGFGTLVSILLVGKGVDLLKPRLTPMVYKLAGMGPPQVYAVEEEGQ